MKKLTTWLLIVCLGAGLDPSSPGRSKMLLVGPEE
jgi:hypothetical protein